MSIIPIYENLTPLHHGVIKKCMQYLQTTSLKIGDKLPTERVLAEIFETSRSTVRVAIKYLVSKGILESKQGSGTYVAQLDIIPPSLSEQCIFQEHSSLFEQVMEFRKIMEPAIAELAAEKCSPEQLNKLKVIVCDQQKHLVLAEGDGGLDAQFHLALAEATGNTLLVETMSKINQLYAEGRTDEYRDMEWRQFSVASHLKIIDTIERKAKDECRKEVEFHIETIHQNHSFFK